MIIFQFDIIPQEPAPELVALRDAYIVGKLARFKGEADLSLLDDPIYHKHVGYLTRAGLSYEAAKAVAYDCAIGRAEIERRARDIGGAAA